MDAIRVTALVATYNHAPFVRTAVRGVLAQEYAPLEILIADDGSTDDTFAIIEEVVAEYRGPHTVRIHRQPRNLGPTANNRWLRENATGAWLVTCDGDDICFPARIARIMAIVRATGCSYVTSNAGIIDLDGVVKGLYLSRKGPRAYDLAALTAFGYQHEMLGATSAFERRLLTVFGFFDESRIAGGGGDQVLPVRAGYFGGACYTDEPLMAYRQHPSQMSRAIADRTKTDAVLLEGYLAYYIKTSIYNLADAEVWAAAHPDDSRIEMARNNLNNRLMALVRRWNLTRTGLLAAGMRSTWVSSDAVAGIPMENPVIEAPSEDIDSDGDA